MEVADKPVEEQALADWRSKHRIDIMDKGRIALEEIRDLKSGRKEVECPSCGHMHDIPWATARDVETATRTLARMVSGLQVDKAPPATAKSLQHVAVDGELSPELTDEIERLADGESEWGADIPEEDEEEES